MGKIRVQTQQTIGEKVYQNQVHYKWIATAANTQLHLQRLGYESWLVWDEQDLQSYELVYKLV